MFSYSNSVSEPASGKAEHISEALHHKCEIMGLEIAKSCVATAADGASVNFGVKAGVLTLLQETMPWMLKVHCVAHRLELAIADAFKNTYFKDEVCVFY